MDFRPFRISFYDRCYYIRTSYIWYELATSSMPHTCHTCEVLCPHAGVQLITCTCVYKSVHAYGLYMCSTPINILQMAMSCKCNILLNHWFFSAKQSQDWIPLLNSLRIIIFSNSAIILYSKLVIKYQTNLASAKQHWITFFRNVMNYVYDTRITFFLSFRLRPWKYSSNEPLQYWCVCAYWIRIIFGDVTELLVSREHNFKLLHYVHVHTESDVEVIPGCST